MRRIATLALFSVTMFAGFILGLRSNPQVVKAITGLQADQLQSWSMLALSESVPVSVTLAIPDGDDVEEVTLPMVFEYQFQVDLTSGTTTTFAIVDPPTPATSAEIIEIAKENDLQYDMAGIPYIITKSDDVNATWGIGNSLGDFVVNGSVENNSDKFIDYGQVFVSAYDLEGRFLNTDFSYKLFASDENPIEPGGSAAFYVGLDDAPVEEVGFYRIHVETTFTDEPTKQGR